MDTRPRYDYAGANLLKRAIRRSAGWKPLSLFYSRTLHLFDQAVFKLTRGRATFTSWLAGLPVAWLTTTGAKSGAERTSPVLAIPCGDDRLIVIASNYGLRKNPSWYHNLRANPRARIEFEGSERQTRRAGSPSACAAGRSGPGTTRRASARAARRPHAEGRDGGIVSRRPRYRVILPN
jgi:deazaflavin-dependent oxidoreductase (nitroreductase family)